MLLRYFSTKRATVCYHFSVSLYYGWQGYGLEEAAAEAVRRWQFEPAVRNGAPVQGSTTVLVEFRRKVVGKATETVSARPAPVMDRPGF